MQSSWEAQDRLALAVGTRVERWLVRQQWERPGLLQEDVLEGAQVVPTPGAVNKLWGLEMLSSLVSRRAGEQGCEGRRSSHRQAPGEPGKGLNLRKGVNRPENQDLRPLRS